MNGRFMLSRGYCVIILFLFNILAAIPILSIYFPFVFTSKTSLAEMALEERNCAKLIQLLDNGLDPNAVVYSKEERDSWRNLIHIACENRDLCAIRALVERGANINAEDSSQRSIVYFIFVYESEFRELDYSVLKYLVEHGLISRQDNKRSILRYAVRSLGDERIVSMIIESGYDPNLLNQPGQFTVFDDLFYILDDRTKSDLIDEEKYLFIQKRTRSLAEILLGAGTNPDIKNEKGISGRDWLTKYHMEDLLRP